MGPPVGGFWEGVFFSFGVVELRMLLIELDI